MMRAVLLLVLLAYVSAFICGISDLDEKDFWVIHEGASTKELMDCFHTLGKDVYTVTLDDVRQKLFWKLATLPEDFFKPLTSLREIEIHHTSIASLPEGIFSSLYQITNIDLDENKLVSPLPENLLMNIPFTGKKVRVSMYGNPGLTCLPAYPDHVIPDYAKLPRCSETTI